MDRDPSSYRLLHATLVVVHPRRSRSAERDWVFVLFRHCFFLFFFALFHFFGQYQADSGIWTLHAMCTQKSIYFTSFLSKHPKNTKGNETSLRQYSNHIALDLWITLAHSSDRCSSRLISLCVWVTNHSSIFLCASSIQAINWSCG